MPTGLGATLMKEIVGMFQGGEWAQAIGVSVNEAVIESTKNIEIVIAEILFFSVFILYFFLSILFWVKGKLFFSIAPLQEQKSLKQRHSYKILLVVVPTTAPSLDIKS